MIGQLRDQDEARRLEVLKSYNILDTEAEKELDELTEIASAICETPISLISLVDEERQWFKSKKGLDVEETPREHAFCQHTLHKPDEVLVVDNPLKDQRFEQNPLVLGDPNIRFYAGAPLVASGGNVLGTLCIIDQKKRSITSSQMRALQLLAKRVMDYFDMRKRLRDQEESIESSARRLKQLTDQAPGALYQLRIAPDGGMKFDFISDGITKLHPTLRPEELKRNAEIAFSVVHPNDVQLIQNSLAESQNSLRPMRVIYRVITKGEQEIEWHETIANPERLEDGSTVWYGAFIDITREKEYEKSLEEFLFSISHELRRPVSNLLGLTQVVDKNDPKQAIQCFSMVKRSAEEMDEMVKKLNEIYSTRRTSFG